MYGIDASVAGIMQNRLRKGYDLIAITGNGLDE